MDGLLGITDILSMAASGSLPQPQQTPNNMTTMGPAPLQPPAPQPHLQMPLPQQPKQQNSFDSVGARKRYDHQQALSGIAQMVKAGGDYIQARKNRALQSDIDRLLSAQQGLEEAKSNPNDPKSQEAIAHNTAIINDITSDPKKSKQIQKAFNIDLFGGGKNKNENKALVDAWKGFQEKQKAGDKTAMNPVAQKLMQQQPMRQQIDPQAQIQAQMIKAGLLPNANAIMKAQSEAMKTMTEAKTAQDQIVGRQKAAEALALARKYGGDKALEAANVRAFGTQQAALIRFQADTLKAKAMLQAVGMRVDAMKEIAHSKQGDKGIQNLYKESTILKQQSDALIKKRKDMEDQLNKYAASSGMWGKVIGAMGMGSKSTMTAEEAKKMGQDLLQIKIEQNSVDGKWRDIQMRSDMYVKMGTMPDPTTMDDPEKLFTEDDD